jgi:hypothetical protein
MLRRIRLSAVVVPLVALAVLSLTCTSANAQVKPFKISGAGVAPTGVPLPGQGSRPHWIVGAASQLGLHYGDGSVVTETAVFEDDGRITGTFGSGEPFVFVGLNGDVLSCTYGRDAAGNPTGTFTLFPVGPEGTYVALWIADFVPLGDQSTGQFAGVSGSWVMYALSAPFQLGSSEPLYYAWQGSGSLNFKKRR